MAKGDKSFSVSTAAIVEGKRKFDLGVNIIELGSYAMVYGSTKNNMKSRSIHGIALRPVKESGGQ